MLDYSITCHSKCVIIIVILLWRDEFCKKSSWDAYVAPGLDSRLSFLSEIFHHLKITYNCGGGRGGKGEKKKKKGRWHDYQVPWDKYTAKMQLRKYSQNNVIIRDQTTVRLPVALQHASKDNKHLKMYLDKCDHHVAKITPLNILVVIRRFNAKEIINHSSFCSSHDLSAWEGFRTIMSVAHCEDNRTANAILYFQKIFLSLAV